MPVLRPKSWPQSHEGSEAPALGQHLLDDGYSYPVATLRLDAIEHNLRWMQAWAKRKGAYLAPHGKTTLSPELWRMQLQAGAWGLTVAHVRQAFLAVDNGAQRCIIANQVFSSVDLSDLHALLDQQPHVKVWFLVDSLQQLRLIEAWHAAHASERCFDVLLELGTAGFRTGCRTSEEAFHLARAIHASPAVRLAGIEVYEGGLAKFDLDNEAASVSELLSRSLQVIHGIDAEDLWQDEQVLVTAGGSAIFDLVMPLLSGLSLKRSCVGVLRSGCYITHDHGHYADFLRLVEQREHLPDSLKPALEVWALVQSVPEPGLAILSAGRRDVSYDQRMPTTTQWASHGGRVSRPAPMHWKIQTLSDQHAHMRFDPSLETPCVGDRIALGISHPCTTFDKWQRMVVIDQDMQVVGSIHTEF